jgi:spore maturation protein CgeB
MKIVILGLTLSSSWGNGHATTYRALCRALHDRGHNITFFERDVPWYRENRDLVESPYCALHLYSEWTELQPTVLREAREADVVIIGSYFPDAVVAADVLFEECGTPVLFYDIDTPITLAALRERGHADYIEARQIPRYRAYLSFTGGPMLRELEERFGSPFAAPLYCSVDPAAYQQKPSVPAFTCDLSYLGTYARDRQTKLMALLDGAARRLPEASFLVAGPMYPADIEWAPNVARLDHVAPREHAAFYSSARFSLNLTREDMVRAGYSPSVRLFEAAACGATMISDTWAGLESFFTPGEEILLATDVSDVTGYLRDMPEEEARRIGARARERVLALHTAEHRAREFEEIVTRVLTGIYSGDRQGGVTTAV